MENPALHEWAALFLTRIASDKIYYVNWRVGTESSEAEAAPLSTLYQHGVDIFLNISQKIK
jgi:hypothetical protein